MLGCKFSSESIQRYFAHCGLYSTVPVEDVVDTLLTEGSWITIEREREQNMLLMETLFMTWRLNRRLLREGILKSGTVSSGLLQSCRCQVKFVEH
jgi:hypothetical protein